jgi:alpha-beta hydrolase superfamily lysophospholipase
MPDNELKPRQEEVAALGPTGFSKVAYVEWGPPDAEQVVMCVHGLTRTGRDFDFLARRLAIRGIRVLAPRRCTWPPCRR